MGRHKLFYQDAKTVRDRLNTVIEMAADIHQRENSLIKLLCPIDQKKLYVRYGFNSLTGFCRYGLQFSKTQTQRIVTQVRRDEPTVNFVEEDNPIKTNPPNSSSF